MNVEDSRREEDSMIVFRAKLHANLSGRRRP